MKKYVDATALCSTCLIIMKLTLTFNCCRYFWLIWNLQSHSHKCLAFKYLWFQTIYIGFNLSYFTSLLSKEISWSIDTVTYKCDVLAALICLCALSTKFDVWLAFLSGTKCHRIKIICKLHHNWFYAANAVFEHWNSDCNCLSRRAI